MQPIWQALYDANADVVLSGHEHNYERFAPQTPGGQADALRGIREFVVGTGGKGHYPFAAPLANSEVRNADTFGVLKLTLHANGYDWTFVPGGGQERQRLRCRFVPRRAGRGAGTATGLVNHFRAGGGEHAVERFGDIHVLREREPRDVHGEHRRRDRRDDDISAIADWPRRGSDRYAGWAVDPVGNVGLTVERTWTDAEPPTRRAPGCGDAPSSRESTCRGRRQPTTRASPATSCTATATRLRSQPSGT